MRRRSFFLIQEPIQKKTPLFFFYQHIVSTNHQFLSFIALFYFFQTCFIFQFSSLYKFTGRIYCAIISAAAYDSFFFSFYCDSLSRFPTGAHFQLFLYRRIFQPREASFFAIFTAMFRSTLLIFSVAILETNGKRPRTHKKKPSLRIVLSMVW